MARSFNVYDLARPAMFAMDPENGHRLAIRALQIRHELGGKARNSAHGAAEPGPLGIEVAGLRFPNPVGVAAGFDKDAEVPDALLDLGFGFTEIGTVTPLPQSGNPRPRLFRLSDDSGVINRMGFNNAGAARIRVRLKARPDRDGIVGVNIGANKDSADRIGDYAVMAELMAPLASYLAINVSSPNTPGLRSLQDPGSLRALIDAVIDARRRAAKKEGTQRHPPIFLKVAPDLDRAGIEAIARIAIDTGLGALIVSNTTLERPALKSKHRDEAGGLSGKPLRQLALDRLRDFRRATDGAIPLIGVGGIATAEDAWERIRAGASLVQLYSAMVYHGPGIGGRIADGLAELMARDGFESIADAVGTE